jgi:tetratricopeptide (TPR) repeat protein
MLNRPYYSPRQVGRLCGLSPGQLRRWKRLGLLPAQRRYHWHDLLRIRALARCGQGISSRSLHRSFLAACARFPEMRDPWLEANFEVFARKLQVRFDGQLMDPISGQLRLPFEAPLSSLELKPKVAPGQTDAQADAQAEQWFAFGLTLEREPDMKAQAVAAYQRCLELDPCFASAHINLGTLHYQAREFPAAEASYRAALALDPNYALAHFNLANVLDETGCLEQAIAEYLEAARLVPDYSDAHYNLALAYQRLGQHRRAIPHWQRYLGLDRQSPWALHARTQLKQTLQRDPLRLVK